MFGESGANPTIPNAFTSWCRAIKLYSKCINCPVLCTHVFYRKWQQFRSSIEPCAHIYANWVTERWLEVTNCLEILGRTQSRLWIVLLKYNKISITIDASNVTESDFKMRQTPRILIQLAAVFNSNLVATFFSNWKMSGSTPKWEEADFPILVI